MNPKSTGGKLLDAPFEAPDNTRNAAQIQPNRTALSPRNVLGIALLVLIVATFYVASIRRGNFWPDDYALYVHHAENIAEGRAYADTGYIYNPAAADYSPRAYPPVFPLLLAPIYRAYGLDLHAMKVEEVVFFALALATVAIYWRRDLEGSYLLALVALLGFSPIFWMFKDSVVADIPFLFFFYLTALVAQAAPREGPGWWKWALASGLLLYLCIGTRTIGFSLLLGLPLFDVLKYRKVTRFSMIAVVVCVAIVLAQRQLLGTGEQSYADQLHPTLASVMANLKDYSSALVSVWTRSLGRVGTFVLFSVTTAFACLGGLFEARKGITTIAAFLLPYLGVVLVWPTPQGLRFLLPLVPFYLYLMLLGIQSLAVFLRPDWAKAALVATILLISVSYGLAFRRVNYGVIPQADGRPSFNDLCRFIRSQTNANDVFIFRRGRALSLFTSRPAAVYDLKHGDRLPAYLATIHASYIVASPLFEEDRTVLIPFIQAHSSSLNEVYENADFQMYRIVDGMSGSLVSPNGSPAH